VTIGDDFTAHAHAIVREGCRIGNRCLLQNGVVIGADGFGFAPDADKKWHKIPQSGPTILEDDVEVQSLAAIDRASVGQTLIRRGAKIDNLVQVGHGSTVGEDSLLCAQVGLAGSTEIGNRVILAGQVGVAGHCTIGDGVIATAKSGIHGDVAPGKVMSGYPAVENRQWLRASAAFSKLPELVRKLRPKNVFADTE
jgi:UDP-3-O-[3-hydroxymyristoyl] glucosamine N-acyltransferase